MIQHYTADHLYKSVDNNLYGFTITKGATGKSYMCLDVTLVEHQSQDRISGSQSSQQQGMEHLEIPCQPIQVHVSSKSTELSSPVCVGSPGTQSASVSFGTFSSVSTSNSRHTVFDLSRTTQLDIPVSVDAPETQYASVSFGTSSSVSTASSGPALLDLSGTNSGNLLAKPLKGGGRMFRRPHHVKGHLTYQITTKVLQKGYVLMKTDLCYHTHFVSMCYSKFLANR